MSRHLIVRDQSAANCFLNIIIPHPRERERNAAESVANGPTSAYLLFFDGEFRESHRSRSYDGPTCHNSRHNEGIIFREWKYSENSLRIFCENGHLSNISRLYSPPRAFFVERLIGTCSVMKYFSIKYLSWLIQSVICRRLRFLFAKNTRRKCNKFCSPTKEN